MAAERCSSHPVHPVDDCPVCEARIARAELAAEETEPSEADRDADRYERWLGGRVFDI